MRTPLLAPFQEQLAGYNDELCYLLFAESEVTRLLCRFGPGAQDRYTVDVFADNPHAKRIHVRIADLGEFQARNRQFGFGAYFSVSYEAFSEYFEQAIALLTSQGSRAVTLRKDNRIERQFEGTLLDSGYGTAGPEIFHTLEYMRLRRNHFIHLVPMANQPYAEITRVEGPGLNAYWCDTRMGLDFTVAALGPPGEQEAIALLKLLRICLEHIDAVVAAGLDWKAIIKRDAASVVGGAGGSSDRECEKAARTLVYKLTETYGYQLDASDARRAIDDAAQQAP